MTEKNYPMDDMLILVDEKDNPIGTVGKTEGHLKGLLHRAFSVFIFNNKGELLIQKRSANKYHSAGLWTNTCCSHPAPGENTMNAASRRLLEEMNISTPLEFVCSFQYKTIFTNGLTENEIDHVFYGVTNDIPGPDPDEASEWKYIKPENLIQEIKSYPELYTSWLKICIDRNIFQEIIKIKSMKNVDH